DGAGRGSRRGPLPAVLDLRAAAATPAPERPGGADHALDHRRHAVGCGRREAAMRIEGRPPHAGDAEPPRAAASAVRPGEQDASVRVERKRALAAERGRVTPRHLAPVVRRTARLDELVRWYEVVLGAEVVHADRMLAFLTYDDEHHRIAIVSIPGLPEQP